MKKLALLLILLAVLPGCRLYSYADDSHTQPTKGYPVEQPVVGSYTYKGAAPDRLVDAMKKVVEESKVVDPAQAEDGLALKVYATANPDSIPVWVDVLNVLTVFLFPKLRDNTLTVYGEVWDGNAKVLEVKRQAKIGSIESFLPFLFFPPSWFFITDTYGGGKGVPVYEKLTREVCVEVADKVKAGIKTTPKEAPCPVCSEPRGNVTPCPHCGMQ